jgi:hypothetical protein
VQVRVQAGPGATITFPDGPDSTGVVQALDPVKIRDTHTPDATDRTATYRVAAWDVGRLPVVLPDVEVREDGAVHEIPLSGITVLVRSVLPVDSAQRVPKPARGLLVGWPVPWWVLGVLAVLLFLLWLAWRRRRRDPGPAVPAVPPFERAQRDFARIAALGLIEAGERGRYLTLMVEVLRDYLAGRFALAALSLTSDELLAELREATTIPPDRLAGLLHESDLVKFARRGLTAERALALGEEARAIVAHEHVASTPPPATEAA